MKLALAMIVKGTDEESLPLIRCLSHVTPYVDGVYITVTHKKGEEPSKKVIDACEKFDAKISYFEWEDDFAKARNFNFKQVPKEYDYILWCDADDTFEGLENLRGILEKNSEIDVFPMFYKYAFDEWGNPTVVHMKTQVVKNGCVKWEGKLHEDFTPTRELKSKFIEDINRVHLSTDKRFKDNSQRNLRISKKAYEENPQDPRTHWNYGKSLLGVGKEKEAIEVFSKFLEKSQSEEEKYLVYLNLADCSWNLGESENALKFARSALGMKPEYPDAYFKLGKLLLRMDRFKESIKYIKLGLVKQPQYHSIIVYNPREYDLYPLRDLATAYFGMDMPSLALSALEACLEITPKDQQLKGLVKKIKKQADIFDKAIELREKLKDASPEKVKKEVDKLDEKIRSHPVICNLVNTKLIKKKSSGKDLVFFCGWTKDEWNPDVAKNSGIGGSEEAVIWLSKLLAKKGWNVTVYNSCGSRPKEYDGVTYKPFWMWNYRDRQDATILWRTPRMLDYNINSKGIYLDLHDVISPGELTENRVDKLDKIFVKSEFHRSLFPDVKDDKFVIVPNGIDSDKFKGKFKKDPKLLINTSSPDRSLNVLIDLFKEVRKEVPDAKLKWAYGWNVFNHGHAGDQEKMQWKEEVQKKLKETEGIEDLGRIGHEEVAKLYQEASIFAYPSEFAEIDCISLTKAMASGCVPVTTDFAAMGEKVQKPGVFIKSKKNKDNWAKPYQFDFSIDDEKMKKQWVKETVKLLKNPPKESKEMREWALEKFNWNNIADKWNKELK